MKNKKKRASKGARGTFVIFVKFLIRRAEDGPATKRIPTQKIE